VPLDIKQCYEKLEDPKSKEMELKQGDTADLRNVELLERAAYQLENLG